MSQPVPANDWCIFKTTPYDTMLVWRNHADGVWRDIQDYTTKFDYRTAAGFERNKIITLGTFIDFPAEDKHDLDVMIYNGDMPENIFNHAILLMCINTPLTLGDLVL